MYLALMAKTIQTIMQIKILHKLVLTFWKKVIKKINVNKDFGQQ
jgi:hypothetical protein